MPDAEWGLLHQFPAVEHTDSVCVYYSEIDVTLCHTVSLWRECRPIRLQEIGH